MKKFLVSSLLLLASLSVFAQSSIIRGEESAGVYANLKSTSGVLQIQSGSSAAAALSDGASNPTVTGMGVYNLLFNGTTWDRSRSAAGTVGIQSVNTEGTKCTYRASIQGLVVAAAATDFFEITGSATKTVKITQISTSAVATAASTQSLAVIKRSTVDTTGTFTNPTAVPLNSGCAAGTATIKAYTVNPGALGTVVGTVAVSRFGVGIATAATVFQPALYQFGNANGSTVAEVSSAQSVALNYNAQTTAGNLFDIWVEWTEE